MSAHLHAPILVTLAQALARAGAPSGTGAFTGSIVLGRDRGLALGRPEHTPDSERSTRRSDWPTRAPAARGQRGRRFLDRSMPLPDRASSCGRIYYFSRPCTIRPNGTCWNTLTRILVRLRSSTPRSAGCSRRLTDAGGSPARSWSVAGDHGESARRPWRARSHGSFVYRPLFCGCHSSSLARASKRTAGEHGTTGRPIPPTTGTLDLAGRLHMERMDGVSLVGFLHPWQDAQGRGRDVYAGKLFSSPALGWAPSRTSGMSGSKLIDAPRPELYDMTRDPFEERTSWLTSNSRCGAASAAERCRPVGNCPRSTAGIETQVQERLSSLGYAGTSVGDDASSPERLPDPKDCISSLHRALLRRYDEDDRRSPIARCDTSASDARQRRR